MTTYVDDRTGATNNSEIVVIVCFDEVARAIPTIRFKATIICI